MGHVIPALFLRGRKANISLVFASQFYFKVPRTITLNSKHSFIIKTSNKRELQEKASNHLYDTEFKDFMKLCKNYTKDPFSLLVNNTVLHSDNA